MPPPIIHANVLTGLTSWHDTCPYLRKVPPQVAEGQRGGAETAQRVPVPQRQVKEIWMARLCTVQRCPCHLAEPAQVSSSLYTVLIAI